MEADGKLEVGNCALQLLHKRPCWLKCIKGINYKRPCWWQRGKMYKRGPAGGKEIKCINETLLVAKRYNR